MTFWQSLLQRVLSLVSPGNDGAVAAAATDGDQFHGIETSDRNNAIFPLLIVSTDLISATLKPQSVSMSNVLHKPTDADPPSAATSAIDTDIEEDVASISEHISFDDSNITESEAVGASGVQLSNAQLTAAAAAAKKRQLFAFGDDDSDADGGPMFRMDDALLDGGRIAEHFRVADDGDFGEVGDSGDAHPVAEEPPRDVLKLDIAAAVTSSSITPPKSLTHKEISPLNDDVILLNNDKISLASLRPHQQLPPLQLSPLQLPPLQLKQPLLKPMGSPRADENPSSATTNQNTTNDVSDLVPDDDEGDDGDDGGSAGSLGFMAETVVPEKPEPGAGVIVDDADDADSNIEAEQSIDEILVSNASISVDLVPKVTLTNRETAPDASRPNDTLDDISVGSVKSEAVPAVTKGDAGKPEVDQVDQAEVEADSLDIVSDGVLELKQRILSAQLVASTEEHVEISEEAHVEIDPSAEKEIKPMMRMETSNKEALDDISEVTEPSADQHLLQSQVIDAADPSSRLRQTGAAVRQTIIQSQPPIDETGAMAEANANSFDSVISLHMLEAYETRIRELEATVTTRDVCLSALSLQLQRRESLKDVPLDSCSLATSSTEYRTYQDECFAGSGGALSGRPEFHTGILEREQLIEQLTDALQQSMQSRELLQAQSERMGAELVQLRKQCAETGSAVRRPLWMLRSGERDSFGGGGQRLSEISIDLVNDSDAEEVVVAEQQQRVQTMACESAPVRRDETAATGKSSLDELQRVLSVDERAVFASMRQKFDEYMRTEVQRVKAKCEEDVRMVTESLAAERNDKETEMNRLRQLLANTKGGSPEICELRRELESIHGREMEDLRTYFERKCADLEKQYSEEIFSQHSRRHSNDSASEMSDQEPLSDDRRSLPNSPKHDTPRRKSTKPDIWSSPTHRKITPTSIGADATHVNPVCSDEPDPEPTVQEVESFYRDKIAEINRQHEESVRMMKFRLKRFECRNSDDEFMPTTRATAAEASNDTPLAGADDDDDDITSLKDVAAAATGGNDSQVITQIVEEYEQRLQAQVALAKEDIVNALEEQIKALLSETSTDDSQWPPELILLREKFTAKSQLEIAQLQIAHKDEMDRIKADFDKQLTRKQRRHTTFDENRDLDQIVLERDNLRELCHTFRWLLSELAKCVSVCEDDLNKTLVAELHKHGIDALGPLDRRTSVDDGHDVHSDRSLEDLNDSLGSSQHSLDMSTAQQQNASRIRLVPDVSGILDVIEDPSLLDFVDQQSKDSSFNLNECVDRLKVEAMQLLELSENLCKKKFAQQQQQAKQPPSEKGDSCEEEDGLRSKSKKHRWLRHNHSLNENILCGSAGVRIGVADVQRKERLSLPGSLLMGGADEESRSVGSVSELTSQLNDLRNRLLVSETDRVQLRVQLDEAQKRHDELSEILNMAKEHMEQLERQKEEISEGFGISQLKSPSHVPFDVSRTSYTDLQNTARSILNVTPDRVDGTVLLQQIEDFCSKLDRFVEEEKLNKTDLQEQIDAAYKQKKSNSKLLEQQAFEWQLERDEFTQEIEKLGAQLRDREKECVAYGHVVKEVETMEQQIKEMTLSIASYEDKKHQLEVDLKEHIDKIFVLREVIKNLEGQIDAKSASESSLLDKVKHLEAFVTSQTQTNESLHDEVEELKQEYVVGYGSKIAQLEEQLRTVRPSGEQQQMMEQVAAQLKDIETVLVRKTRHLEALHSDICSATCSTHSEDVSKGQGLDSNADSPQLTPRSPHCLPVDDVQRIMDKLTKHNRAEEAAVKRIRDLEMQMATLRTSHDELQSDRDLLQEKMSEQILRISTLQSRLDEQRHRAEEIHRQGTSDLSLRVYELQAQLSGVQELLIARDQQIVTLKSHLEQSKQIIDRQEADLAAGAEKAHGARMEADLRARDEEIRQLKERMRGEMISKMALPDLMETMLAEKNDEIDHLKEQLAAKRQQLQQYLDLHLSDETMAELRQQQQQQHQQRRDTEPTAAGASKLSARTLSDIVSLSEYDEESDIDRKMASNDGKPIELSSNFFAMTERKPAAAFGALSVEPSPIEAPLSQQAGGALPKPRQIQFSLTDESTGLGRGVAAGADLSADQLPSIVPQLQQEIAELQRRLDRLSATDTEVQSLKLQLDEVQNEKTSIAGELNRHRDAASSLKLDIAAKSQAIAELMDEKRQLQVELHDVRGALQKLKDVDNQLEQRSSELADLRERFDVLSGRNDELQQRVQSLGEQLTKREKDAANYARNEADFLRRIDALQAQQNADLPAESVDLVAELRTELEATKTDLFERMIDFEKSQLDVQELRQKLDARRAGSASPAPFDDIAESVAKELNYSAHLDSSILKAIESDELNSDEDRLAAQRHLLSPKSAEIDRLQQQLDTADALRQQDAAVIDAMRVRLEAAVEMESGLQQQLADERSKVDRLATQVLVHQRSSQRDSSLLLKSPPDSPRRSPRSVDSVEAEQLVSRLQSEIKLLTAQSEREKERLTDTERVLEREKMRFEKELADRKDHGERMKRDMDRVLQEKALLGNELDSVQERLAGSAHEIASLEARIASLQEAEARRSTRRGLERTESTQQTVDVHELRLKLAMAERERDTLAEKCTVLRADLERSAQREAQLTEALVKEHSGDGLVPQQFLQKLASIAENTKEYRQMAQTLQFLTEERHALQQRVDELELRNRAFNRDELEKRANHLFGKYLRVESFRKALVHQKRYLLIMLQTYQENEAKALALIKSRQHPVQQPKPKRPSFRSAVLVVIAIERMKYIVRRWQTGKRVGSEAIFSHQLPRRSASATTNIWAHIAPATMAGQTPPCRDRPPYHGGPMRSGSAHSLHMRSPLHAPALIAECSERLEAQQASASPSAAAARPRQWT